MSTKMSTDLNISRPTSRITKAPGGASTISFGDYTPGNVGKTVVAAPKIEAAVVEPEEIVVTIDPQSSKYGIVIGGSVASENLAAAILKALAMQGIKSPSISYVNEVSVLPYAAINLSKSCDVIIAAAIITVDPHGVLATSIQGSLMQIGVNQPVPIIPALVTQSSLLEAKALLPSLSDSWTKAAISAVSLTSKGLEVTTAPAIEIPTVPVHSPTLSDATDLMAVLKESIKARGARGIFGIGRLFKIMDDNNNGQIELSEFTKAIHEYALDWTPAQSKSVFDMFDEDKSGSISYDEFLVGLRGELNDRRKQFVLMAFEILDSDKNGTIEINDITAKYNAEKHPDVISGKRTAVDVLTEFLETFEGGGGEKDGKITPAEFSKYYEHVSASIDDDDYFELMMRNAWHISGGEGWCANTSCRRVLITHTDGRQTVGEIKNDLGVKETDKEAMIANLVAQGITDIADIGVNSSASSKVDTVDPVSKSTAVPKSSVAAGIVKPKEDTFRPAMASSQYNRGRAVGGATTIVLG